MLRLPREGGTAPVAEKRAMGVERAADRALLVFDLRAGVGRFGRGGRLPVLALFVQVVEDALAVFLIASPMVGGAAFGANDDIIPRAEGHSAHRALDPSIIQHK